jgi:hypothetical protein
MKHKIDIKQELNEIGVSVPIRTMPEMNLPLGYFNTFSTTLLEQIHTNDFISALPQSMPYQIPNAYLENFSTELLDSIHQVEFIESLPKNIPYEVPKDYFLEFPALISRHINQVQNQLTPYTFSRKFVAKLSIAATLFLFVGLAFKGLTVSSKTDEIAAIQNKLSTISDQEINQYILDHQTEIESSLALETIDETKIDLQKLEIEMLDHSLNNISDEELLNYTF